MRPNKLINLILLLLLAQNSFAQRSYLSTLRHFDGYSEAKKARLKRYYFGYGIPTMSVDVTTHYVAPGDIGATVPVPQSERTRLDHLTISSGWGGTAGTFYVLAGTTRQSAVCLEIAFSEYFYQYNFGPASYGPATFSDQSIVGLACMPIGIAYKSGGEVTLNKHDRSTLSISAGIAPFMSISKFLAAQAQFSARPYFAFEVGAFAGIEWKFRAAYFAGKTTLVDVTADGLDNVSKYTSIGGLGTMDVKAVAGGDFNLALTILPFSFKWAKQSRYW
jgi:hypothetical protein